MRTFSKIVLLMLFLSRTVAGQAVLGQSTRLYENYGMGRQSFKNGNLRLQFAQGRTVRQDSAGRTYTLFDFGRKNQVIMLGTPYWTYPTWQGGTVQPAEDSPATPCQIAYNVASNEVLCRFNNDTTIHPLKPVAFTIGDEQFVRRNQLGYPAYYRVVYRGQAELLEGVKRPMTVLKPQPYGDAYLMGYFLGLERYYYLKLPDGPLRSLELNRKSLMRAMGDNVDTKLLPAGETLTINDVVRVLADYDAH